MHKNLIREAQRVVHQEKHYDLNYELSFRLNSCKISAEELLEKKLGLPARRKFLELVNLVSLHNLAHVAIIDNTRTPTQNNKHFCSHKIQYGDNKKDHQLTLSELFQFCCC